MFNRPSTVSTTYILSLSLSLPLIVGVIHYHIPRYTHIKHTCTLNVLPYITSYSLIIILQYYQCVTSLVKKHAGTLNTVWHDYTSVKTQKLNLGTNLYWGKRTTKLTIEYTVQRQKRATKDQDSPCVCLCVSTGSRTTLAHFTSWRTTSRACQDQSAPVLSQTHTCTCSPSFSLTHTSSGIRRVETLRLEQQESCTSHIRQNLHCRDRLWHAYCKIHTRKGKRKGKY